MLIQANPAGIQKDYLWFCNAVCKWQRPSPELNDMFHKVSDEEVDINTTSLSSPQYLTLDLDRLQADAGRGSLERGEGIISSPSRQQAPRAIRSVIAIMSTQLPHISTYYNRQNLHSIR